MARVKFVYMEFYDVPRVFVVSWGKKLFLFDGHFDSNLDDYPDQYTVYELPAGLEGFVKSMTLEEMTSQGKRICQVPMSEVNFDETRRRTIDDSILRNLTQSP